MSGLVFRILPALWAEAGRGATAQACQEQRDWVEMYIKNFDLPKYFRRLEALAALPLNRETEQRFKAIENINGNVLIEAAFWCLEKDSATGDDDKELMRRILAMMDWVKEQAAARYEFGRLAILPPELGV